MGKTTKVNKDMSLANNLILENDLSVLSGRLYTDINGILFILGLTLFISIVNSFLVLCLTDYSQLVLTAIILLMRIIARV